MGPPGGGALSWTAYQQHGVRVGRQEGKWDSARATTRAERDRCTGKTAPRRAGVEVNRVKSVGRHLILELWGCENLNSTEIVEHALRDVVQACDLTLIGLHVYPFNPIGVTGVAVVAESHVMIHTWP